MEFRIMNYNVDTISSSWHLGIVLDPNLLLDESMRCW